MSFLGMGTFEILVILLVAFIFLGPERMIDAARILGKWTGELRRMGSTVQAEMEDLTNVGDPLASRRPPTQNSTQDDASETPLDQDHPTPFRPQTVEEPESPPRAESSATTGSPPAPATQPQPATRRESNDRNSARKEESA